MKTVLFCNLPYAFSIFKPLADLLESQGSPPLWFMPHFMAEIFPYQGRVETDLNMLENYQSEAIFVCGNDVPFWLHGLKVQVFHGLAGEKKGHFRIRGYFDLYLTQGPYFTQQFKALSKKYHNFKVVETGWCKLDRLFRIQKEAKQKKSVVLNKYNVDKIILYAPTFSPSLSSAPKMTSTIKKLAQNSNSVILVKFHDKMKSEWKSLYSNLSPKVKIIKEQDITPLLQISDLMISDTSSVVYEFIMLDKPVVTLQSRSEHIAWSNHDNTESLYHAVIKTLKGNDTFCQQRQKIIALYHPYLDGNSSLRAIKATKNHIQTHGIPDKRILSLYRKYKLIKKYGASWRRLFF